MNLIPLQIMKSDEDVRMISAEAPVLFARVSHAIFGDLLSFMGRVAIFFGAAHLHSRLFSEVRQPIETHSPARRRARCSSWS